MKILLIEDNDADSRLIKEQLKEIEGQPFEIERVDRLQRGIKRLEKNSTDLVLLDLSLPDSDREETLREIHKQCGHLPIVVLSGHDDDRLAFEAVGAGAQDYLVKGRFDAQMLWRSMRYALERKKSEQTLVKSNAQLTSLIQAIPEIVFLKDNANRLVLVNNAYETLVGKKSKDLVGREETELLPPDLAEACRISDETVRRTRTPVHLPESFKLPGGREIIYDVVKVPVIGKDNELLGIVGVSRDITDLKHREEALSKALKKAKAADEIKSEFLAKVSHELRTPLNAILGMTALLLDTELTDDQRDLTSTLQRSGDSLLVLVNNLLDFSKLQAGKMRLEPIDFEIRPFLEDTLELCAYEAQKKQVEIASTISSSVPARLHGDAGRLRQVLVNLLANAAKFTSEGEIILRVELEEKSGEDLRIKFSVRDSGKGISKASQKQLFKSFSQPTSRGRRRSNGVGLGLAICKQFVELMGGEIHCESSPSQGSTFSFFAMLKQAAGSGPHLPPQTLEGLRVLVAAKNTAVRNSIVEQLSQCKIRADSAENSQEVLKMSKEALKANDPYDCVISDAQMTDMDSLELARRMGKHAALAKTPIIALSFLDELVPRSTWRRAGIEAWLHKPVRMTQLERLLERLAEGLPTDTEERLPQTPLFQKRHFRILLAEDNIPNQTVALRQLKKLGYEADAVANGLEAVEAVSRIAYDLVIMDCDMPEMDGYEAAAEIRRRETGKRRLPIIAMTAYAMPEDRERCFEAGMDDYLAKPVFLRNLVELLENWDRPVDFRSLSKLQEESKEGGFVWRVIENYLSRTPRRIRSIKRALARNSLPELSQETEGLIEASERIGARNMSNIADRLYQTAESGKIDLAACFIDDLQDEFARIKASLGSEFSHN